MAQEAPRRGTPAGHEASAAAGASGPQEEEGPLEAARRACQAWAEALGNARAAAAAHEAVDALLAEPELAAAEPLEGAGAGLLALLVLSRDQVAGPRVHLDREVGECNKQQLRGLLTDGLSALGAVPLRIVCLLYTSRRG